MGEFYEGFLAGAEHEKQEQAKRGKRRLTRQSIEAMSPDEINRRWDDEVLPWLERQQREDSPA